MKLILDFGRLLEIYLVCNTVKDFQGLKNIKTVTFEGYWINIATKIHRNTFVRNIYKYNVSHNKKGSNIEFAIRVY